MSSVPSKSRRALVARIGLIAGAAYVSPALLSIGAVGAAGRSRGSYGSKTSRRADDDRQERPDSLDPKVWPDTRTPPPTGG